MKKCFVRELKLLLESSMMYEIVVGKFFIESHFLFKFLLRVMLIFY